MANVKQRISDWPGNNVEMTSHRNYKLTFSKMLLDLARGFLS